MKRNMILLITMIPVFCAAQWNLYGSFVEGVSFGDRIGTIERMSLDSAGTTLAVGTSLNSDSGTFFGYAKVFDLVGSGWVQRGNTFQGSATMEGTGSAVELSADGNTVAIGSSHGINSMGWVSGLVNVYDWDGISWVLRGATIDGEGNAISTFERDNFGTAIDISPDGNFIAIGAKANTPQVGAVHFSGHVRVYEWDGNNWVQRGQDIDGERSLEDFGASLAMSSDGTALVVGGQAWANDTGIVRMYGWDGTDWVQRGTSLEGVNIDRLGSSVSMSADGNTMVIGAPNALAFAGLVRVFDWDGTDWVQRGLDLVGGASDQFGSSVDLNAAGNILAVGSPWSSSVNGRAKIFEWDGAAWVQVDNTLQGTGSQTAINVFGRAVSLSASGSRVAVGAPSHDGVDSNTGRVYTFHNPSLDVNTGIESSAASVFVNIYPNPSNGQFFVKTNGISKYSIEVYSDLGGLLFSKGDQTGKDQFHLNASPGVYTVVVRTAEESSRHRLVIQ